MTQIATCPVPGVYENIPADEYRSWTDAMNYSRLKVLAESVELFRYQEDHAREATKAMELGSAVDLRIHQPGLYAETYVTAPACDRRTKTGKADWEAFCAASEGKAVIDVADYAKVEAIAASIAQHKRASELLASGKPQVAVVWIDKETGALCKARLDWLPEKDIVDLKTCRDVSPSAFSRAMEEYGYAIQAAFYSDGWYYATGEKRNWLWIAAETSPPFRVRVYAPKPSALVAGRSMYRRALYQYQLCQKTGVWRDTEAVEEVTLPYWALREEGIEPEQVDQF